MVKRKKGKGQELDERAIDEMIRGNARIQEHFKRLSPEARLWFSYSGGPAGAEAFKRITQKQADPYSLEDALRLAHALDIEEKDFWQLTPAQLERLARGWLDREGYADRKQKVTIEKKPDEVDKATFQLIRMMQFLEEHPGATRKELADALGITERQVYRGKIGLVWKVFRQQIEERKNELRTTRHRND